MNEQWITCYDVIEISNFGNVRRKLKNGDYRPINCSIGNRGYKYFQLKRDKKRLNFLVHHLVAKHFISERPTGLVIDHIDRNRLNNCVENLKYTTQQENTRNADRVRLDIPFDENRHKTIMKLNWLKYKEKRNEERRERITCDKCNVEICRGYLLAHSRKCDGTYGRGRSGRKKKTPEVEMADDEMGCVIEAVMPEGGKEPVLEVVELPKPEREFAKEELWALLDSIRGMQEFDKLYLPQDYCEARGIDWNERHRPLTLREMVEKEILKQ